MCYYAALAGECVAGLVVDEGLARESPVKGLPVYGWAEAVRQYTSTEAAFFVSVGYASMNARQKVYERVRGAGYAMVNIVCASSWVAPDVLMGDNNIVMPGVVLEPGVRLAANNVIWSNATICHDTTIGSHNFISAGATLGGRVAVGDRNFLGFGAIVLQGLTVRSDSIVAAGSLVTRDLQGLCEYRGSPAKKTGCIDPADGVMVR
ncbi:MAG: hypothetical protein IPM40_00245 [Gammaproteobacteria bacterium]|nr:hypothetical protein [Gammaproteobacteria bacterium]